MALFVVAITLFVTFLAVLIGRRMYQQQLFQRLGIPYPPDFSFWLGHMIHIASPATRHHYWTEMCKTYGHGDFWGFYMATTPCFMINDPDLVSEIFVRNFESFNARRLVPMTRTSDDIHAEIFSTEGPRWRRQRQIVNAAFATGRLRSNLELIERSIAHMDSVVTTLRSESPDGSINIHPGLELLSMDVISSFAFGIDLFAEGSLRNNKISRLVGEVFAYTRIDLPWWVAVVYAFPEFRVIFNNLEKMLCYFRTGFFMHIIRQVEEIVDTVITTRLENESTRRTDLLQGMIDHMTEEKVDPNVNEGRVYMTRAEVRTTGFIIMVGGEATTANVLAFFIYELVMNLELQNRLRTAIYAEIGATGYDYKNFMKCTLLDWCFKETLRKYPTTELIAARVANKDVVIRGVPIPKGAEVQICVRSLHSNIEYWGPEDPELFVPERFTPDRVENRPQFAYIAFGVGPRMCPGVRLAEIDFKMTIIFLLRKYNITIAKQQIVPLPVVQALDVLVPAGGVSVILEERNIEL